MNTNQMATKRHKSRKGARVPHLVCFLCLFVASSAFAIDNDHDGMSDVWQQLYGIGTEQDGVDIDDDGEVNGREGQAGTDPFDGASCSQLNGARDGTQVSVSWSGVANMRYIVQTSSNLVTWTTLGSETLSPGQAESASDTVPANGPRYYRVKARANLDSDGDQLTDWEEFILGTTDTEWDSEFDGMPDGWEWANLLDPFSDDSADDPDGDEVPNLEEYQNNTNPQDGGSF